jgi:hypothetical protein
MVNNDDLIEIKNELSNGTKKAIEETLNRYSAIELFQGLATYYLCLNMIKYNTVPFATFLLCLACGVQCSSPVIKSIRVALKHFTRDR